MFGNAVNKDAEFGSETLKTDFDQTSDKAEKERDWSETEPAARISPGSQKQIRTRVREMVHASVRKPERRRPRKEKQEQMKRVNEQWGSYGGKMSKKREDLKARGRSKEMNHSFLDSSKKTEMQLYDARSSSLERGEQKMFINLEEIALEEDKLSLLLEGVWQAWNIQKIVEDWWEITNCTSLSKVENLFINERQRKTIRKSKILEIIGMGVITMKASEINDTPTLAGSIRNLVYNIHQNFLIIVEFILSRMPSTSDNLWVVALRSIVKFKKAKGMVEGNGISVLEHQNEIIKNLLQNICYGKARNPLELAVLSMLKIADVASVVAIRDRMYKLIFHFIYTGNFSAFQFKQGDKMEESKSVIGGPPFLPKCDASKDYTLILDLDETLIHYSEIGADRKLNVRPGASEFLEELSKYYEIVVYTAATQDYADWVLDRIDPHKYISYRLYRQHLFSQEGNLRIVKDLKYLGRDLSKIIIIDNIAENFQNQPENGIFIQTYIDDDTDQSLFQLIPLLREIVVTKAEDVRVALRLYRDQAVRRITEGVLPPTL